MTAQNVNRCVGLGAVLGRTWHQFTARRSSLGVLIGFALVPAVVATLNVSSGWDTTAGLKRLPAAWVTAPF